MREMLGWALGPEVLPSAGKVSERRGGCWYGWEDLLLRYGAEEVASAVRPRQGFMRGSRELVLGCEERPVDAQHL